jgi:CheY-like chemotaxis protein
MNTTHIRVLLADDDTDDCDLFKDALEELPVSASLSIVYDGEQLIRRLTDNPAFLPDVIFLDLNMPRKNGLECLTEIMLNNVLKHVPVIILSTSIDIDSIQLLHAKGALYCIRKPNDFGKLKELIQHVLSVMILPLLTPACKDFVLQD